MDSKPTYAVLRFSPPGNWALAHVGSELIHALHFLGKGLNAQSPGPDALLYVRPGFGIAFHSAVEVVRGRLQSADYGNLPCKRQLTAAAGAVLAQAIPPAPEERLP